MDPDGLRDLRLARDLQDMRLRKKKRQTVRPLPGSLFLAKASGGARIPLRAAVCGLPPGRHSPQQVPRRCHTKIVPGAKIVPPT